MARVEHDANTLPSLQDWMGGGIPYHLTISEEIPLSLSETPVSVIFNEDVKLIFTEGGKILLDGGHSLTIHASSIVAGDEAIFSVGIVPGNLNIIKGRKKTSWFEDFSNLVKTIGGSISGKRIEVNSNVLIYNEDDVLTLNALGGLDLDCTRSDVIFTSTLYITPLLIEKINNPVGMKFFGASPIEFALGNVINSAWFSHNLDNINHRVSWNGICIISGGCTNNGADLSFGVNNFFHILPGCSIGQAGRNTVLVTKPMVYDDNWFQGNVSSPGPFYLNRTPVYNDELISAINDAANDGLKINADRIKISGDTTFEGVPSTSYLGTQLSGLESQVSDALALAQGASDIAVGKTTTYRSASAPEVPHHGDIWYNTTTGILSVWDMTSIPPQWHTMRDSALQTLSDSVDLIQTTLGEKVNLTTSSIAPVNPQIGDLWLDTSDVTLPLKVCTTIVDGVATWEVKVFNAIIKSSTAPENPVNGQLWFNTTTGVLAIWDAVSQEWEARGDNTKTQIDGGVITTGVLKLADSLGTVRAGISGSQGTGLAVRFWAGSSDPEEAPFRVMEDGSVYCSQSLKVGIYSQDGASFTLDLTDDNSERYAKMRLMNSEGQRVFEVKLSGEDKGDVIIGRPSGTVINPTSKGIIWDDSAGDLFIYGRCLSTNNLSIESLGGVVLDGNLIISNEVAEPSLVVDTWYKLKTLFTIPQAEISAEKRLDIFLYGNISFGYPSHFGLSEGQASMTLQWRLKVGGVAQEVFFDEVGYNNVSQPPLQFFPSSNIYGGFNISPNFSNLNNTQDFDVDLEFKYTAAGNSSIVTDEIYYAQEFPGGNYNVKLTDSGYFYR